MSRLPTSAELVEGARADTGLTDLGEDSWHEALDVLLGSFAADVQLSADAVPRITNELTAYLTRRLRYVDWWASHPEETDVAVDGPVLVCGLPRTGTTALVGMLACDPASRSLRSWEMVQPFPPPDAATEDDDPRVEAARQSKAMLAEHASELMKMHLLDPLGPEEPHDLLGATFRSQYLCGVYPTRSYGDWWVDCDMTPAFLYQQRVLQTLHHHRPPTRWLLKAPYLAAHVEAFLDVHPGARFVMTHRDPAKAVPSVCSFTHGLLDSVTESWDDKAHFRWLADHWAAILDRAMAARAVIGEDRFLDVDHRDLVRDPMGEVKRIYDFLGWDLTPEAATAIDAYTVENRSQKHGVHDYTAEEFGLTVDGLRATFATYCDRFGV